MYNDADLLQEVSMLSKTARSGFAFLGSGKQSVAEHCFTSSFVGWLLAEQSRPPVDIHKVITLCLIHDLPEARTNDLNYVNKRYVIADEEAAAGSLCTHPILGEKFHELLREFEEGKTAEAKLAQDADQLELIIMLRQLQEAGNWRATAWIERACQRLKTAVGQNLAEMLCETSPDNWWQIK
jgi:putative hydrolase of HD superfamily